MHAVPAIHAPRTSMPCGPRSAEIPDPEIPTISIVDLGVVRSVDLDDEPVSVELLPTFVGCPALEVIRSGGRGPARRRAPDGRGRVHLRRAVDDRPDHATEVAAGCWPAGSRRRRAGGRVPRHSLDRAARRRRRLPHLRLAPDAARQRVRPDALPVDPVLPGLPPTLRRLQGGVTMADEKTGTPPTPPAAPAQPPAPQPAPAPRRAAPPAGAAPAGRRLRPRRRSRRAAPAAGPPPTAGTRPIRDGRPASNGR